MKKLLVILSLVLLGTCSYGVAIAADSNTISSTVTNSSPSTAASPSIQIPQAVCRFGVSGAVSSSVIGISTGMAVTDETCQLVLLAKLVAGLNLKVGSVSILCQDSRVFDGLWNAALFCPKEGKIGEEARDLWLASWQEMPKGSQIREKMELQSKPPKQRMTQDEPKDAKTGIIGLLLALLIL